MLNSSISAVNCMHWDSASERLAQQSRHERDHEHTRTSEKSERTRRHLGAGQTPLSPVSVCQSSGPCRLARCLTGSVLCVRRRTAGRARNTPQGCTGQHQEEGRPMSPKAYMRIAGAIDIRENHAREIPKNLDLRSSFPCRYPHPVKNLGEFPKTPNLGEPEPSSSLRNFSGGSSLENMFLRCYSVDFLKGFP